MNTEDVWKQDAVTTSWFTQKDKSTMDWISKCSQSMNSNSFELGLITMWAIWNSRIAFVVNEENRTTLGTWKFAEGYY